MPRKKQEGITTIPRYHMKMYNIGWGRTGGNPELAKQYADALAIARASGVAPYKRAYETAKAILVKNEVPTALWGLYRAFTLELVHKVLMKKEVPPEQVISKWSEKGLDAAVLSEISSNVVEVVQPTVQTPPSKGA